LVPTDDKARGTLKFWGNMEDVWGNKYRRSVGVLWEIFVGMMGEVKDNYGIYIEQVWKTWYSLTTRFSTLLIFGRKKYWHMYVYINDTLEYMHNIQVEDSKFTKAHTEDQL
jgi:hypothetical protein